MSRLSKLKTLGVGNKIGSAMSRIMGSLWEVSAVISQILLTKLILDDHGDPINDTEAAKQEKLRSQWEKARKTLYWCEKRTRKIVKLGLILTTVAIIIRVILRIAKFATRFSPPAAADFATLYYKAQDILKRVATTTAVISSGAALINLFCAAKLEELYEVQNLAYADDVTEFGEIDPDPYFEFDEDGYNKILDDIQLELEELNASRLPSTQSECDIIFEKLNAIDTLDEIITDASEFQDDPFIMLQYEGGESAIDRFKDNITRIRTTLLR